MREDPLPVENDPSGHPSRRLLRWSWTLIGLSFVAPLILAVMVNGVFELMHPVKQFDPVEWGLIPNDESSAESAWEKYVQDGGPTGYEAVQAADANQSAARPLWEFGAGVLGFAVASVLQLASIRFGLQLAGHWPRALWWVVPQMIVVFSLIAEAVICGVLLLLGQGRTMLQLIAIVGVTLPVSIVVAALLAAWLARSAHATRQVS